VSFSSSFCLAVYLLSAIYVGEGGITTVYYPSFFCRHAYVCVYLLYVLRYLYVQATTMQPQNFSENSKFEWKTGNLWIYRCSVRPLYLFYIHGIQDASFVSSNFVEIIRNKHAYFLRRYNSLLFCKCREPGFPAIDAYITSSTKLWGKLKIPGVRYVSLASIRTVYIVCYFDLQL
jgi:hypothetical protein